MILTRYSYDTMKLYAIADLLQSVDVLCLHDHTITGVAYDSRLVQPGYLFVAVPGTLANGADFISDAVIRGALAIVTEEDAMVPRSVTTLKVPNARLALAQIANAFHQRPSEALGMIGVTGTNGKTTTTYMLHHILGALEPHPGLIGTIGYRIGERILPATRTTPEAPELQAMLDRMIDAGTRNAVMEVSSHALAQERVHGTEFDVAIFTNLTRDHLDYHEDMDTYFAAKAKLFTTLGPEQTAVINIDDPWGKHLLAHPELSCPVITTGTSEEADVRASRIELSGMGSIFQIDTPWGRGEAQLNLMGRFNVANALGAIAAAGARGIDLTTILSRLSTLQAVPGRMERVPTRRGLIYVDYSHTPDALENVLATLREVVPERRLTVVFGCGGNRDTGKRARMGEVAGRLADHTIVTNDNPRKEDPSTIAAGILEGLGEASHHVILDRRDAIEAGVRLLAQGDVVLIAGKGHETTQEFHSTITPFNDREAVERALEESE